MGLDLYGPVSLLAETEPGERSHRFSMEFFNSKGEWVEPQLGRVAPEVASDYAAFLKIPRESVRLRRVNRPSQRFHLDRSDCSLIVRIAEDSSCVVERNTTKIEVFQDFQTYLKSKYHLSD